MFFIPLPYFLAEILIFTTWVHFFGFGSVFVAYLLPSLLGIILFSFMGRRMLYSVQMGFQQGQMPGDRVLHRASILLGSLLLIVPLFMTRVLGALLILPISRHIGILIFKTSLFKKFMNSRSFSFVHYGFQKGSGPERDVDVVNVTPLEVTHTKPPIDPN